MRKKPKIDLEIIKVLATVFMAVSVVLFTVIILFSWKTYVENGDVHTLRVGIILVPIFSICMFLMWRKPKNQKSSRNTKTKEIALELTPLAKSMYQEFEKIQSDYSFVEFLKQKYKVCNKDIVVREMDIFVNCLDIIKGSSNIETILERTTLGLEKLSILHHLCRIHPRLIKQEDIPSATKFCTIAACKIEMETQTNFKKKQLYVNSLKTKKGKINSWKKYLDVHLNLQMKYSLHYSEMFNLVIESIQAQIYALESPDERE